MAGTLSCTPPGFDRGDLAGTVRSLCGYARTLQDNVDFQLGQLRRTQDSGMKQADEANQALREELGRLAARVEALEADRQEEGT